MKRSGMRGLSLRHAQPRFRVAHPGYGRAVTQVTGLAHIYNNLYIYMVADEIKPRYWVGSSRRDLRAMRREVRSAFGQAPYTAQQELTDPAAKPLKGFGATRVMETVERYRTDAYRAVYTAHFETAIYVLHLFQKKSKTGIATPKQEIDLIRKRYAEAERHHKARQN